MLRKLIHFNWVQFVAMVALIALGTVAIWSAGSAREGAAFHAMWAVNLRTATLGLALYFAIAFTDYRKYLTLVAPPAYLAALVLLVAVLAVGSEIYGGRRWLWFFQPSEIAKLCVIAFSRSCSAPPSRSSRGARAGAGSSSPRSSWAFPARSSSPSPTSAPR